MALDTLFTWGPDNAAALLVSTLSKRPKKDIQDAVFNAMPTFEYLNKAGRVMISDGASVIVPLEVAKNTGTSSYDGYEPMSTQAFDNHTGAQYKMKQNAVPVAISEREIAQNKGESALINLLSMKQKNAEKSLRDFLNRKAHGASNSSTDITSLVTLIDATSTIGDINSTANSYWQSLVTTGGVFATTGVANWRTHYNTLKNRGGNPDMFITTQTIHEAYEATMGAQIRYMNLGTGETKFRDLEFAGAKVRFDDQCASGVTYTLDSDVLHFYIWEGCNFVYNQFVRPPEQDAKVAQFRVYCEVGTSNRRLLGKITTQS